MPAVTVSIINLKGGVGKSTLTMLLAWIIHKKCGDLLYNLVVLPYVRVTHTKNNHERGHRDGKFAEDALLCKHFGQENRGRF